ncbi:hypothetical protein [uncultured Gemmiger sp.]|uniref:hypothetical protein n=1 Tax=uncultured Gemmiger sp. TaxID=1623490 RepID=UPI0025FE9024|nr:hypothetical protein [uncultured Gemmiger sp.]
MEKVTFFAKKVTKETPNIQTVKLSPIKRLFLFGDPLAGTNIESSLPTFFQESNQRNSKHSNRKVIADKTFIFIWRSLCWNKY